MSVQMGAEEGEELRRRIGQQDQLYATMQQQGKPFEALEHLEKGLFLRKELLGPHHPEVSKVSQVFTTSCNTLAMNSLQRDNHLLAYELLKKAEILTSPSGYITDKKLRLKLRAVTFNNFGCFYKRRGKLHAALQYLAKALKIELTSEEVDNPAGTHLNLCATLSQLGRHGPALEHAQCALELLQAMQESREQRGETAGKEGGSEATDDGSIMAIAWHNMAVEQEHLHMLDAALHSYEQAVIVAEKEWGAGHIKTLAIKHSLDDARGKVAARRANPNAHKPAPSHAGASPLDAVLDPNSASAYLNNFRQSGIKTSQSKSPLAPKGGKSKGAIKAYGGNSTMKASKTAVSESWGDYLSNTMGPSSEGTQLPAIGRQGNTGNQSGFQDSRMDSSDLPDVAERRGPRTPSPGPPGGVPEDGSRPPRPGRR